jgi:thermostable 8-oxoguanine DNA glycosylase
MADYTFTLPSKLKSKAGIDFWAERYRYKSEQPLIDMKATIQKKGYMTKEQLYTLVDWKSRRSTNLPEKNTPENVQEITQAAFAVKGDAAILVLWGLKGIWSPIASTILHFYHEEDYPIIDKHALWTLTSKNIDIKKYEYDYPLWKEYTQFCRKLAKRYKVSMRDLDKALWQYSVEKQKK